MNTNFSKNFLYFRAIQRHSGGTLVVPTLQDNVLLPDDFAEYIYHIGNAHDMHSIIRTDANQDLEEVPCDLNKPRITVYKNTWRGHQNTVYWCNQKLAQRKGLQFCQTRSHAIALLNTQPAICIENSGRHEDWRGFILQSTSIPQGYHALYSRQICNMDVRILLIPKRENPPTINANKARSTRKLVARISRSLVASISMNITERSTRKLVAVTLITELKEYLNQPSRKKTLIAKKS